MTAPCTMEACVAALRTEGLSQGVVNASIANWLKGDFEAALRPFDSNIRKCLIAEGGATKELHGPYGWLNGYRALSEDSWELENDPIGHDEEYFSIPLYALTDPFKEIGQDANIPAPASTGEPKSESDLELSDAQNAIAEEVVNRFMIERLGATADELQSRGFDAATAGHIEISMLIAMAAHMAIITAREAEGREPDFDLWKRGTAQAIEEADAWYRNSKGEHAAKGGDA